MQDLKDLSFCRVTVIATEVFPRFDVNRFRKGYPPLRRALVRDPHHVIPTTALDLWDGDYDFILRDYGFWDQYQTFTGHCHQITPMLGFVLLAHGLEEVEYVECYRAHPSTGEMIPPTEEQGPLRDEFISIGRIPYCCLGVKVQGRWLYLSGKHLRPRATEGARLFGAQALLTPDCYRPFEYGFTHQDDLSKSGVYLDVFTSDHDLEGPFADNPITWKKQGPNDREPEFFRSYCHMRLSF